MAEEFVPLPGVTERESAEAALLASLSDDTPEGRSIVALAAQKYGLIADEERIREIRPVQGRDPHERCRDA